MRVIETLREKNKYKMFFYSVMALSLAALLFFGLLSGGNAFGTLFFKSKTDSFMDHMNSVVYNETDPYKNRVIYPPLASLTYALCNKIIPSDQYAPIISDPAITSQPYQLKIYQGFWFQFIIFAVISMFLMYIATDTMKKGSKPEKWAFLLLCSFSAPFLFMVERGNNVIIPLAFTMFFIAFYDSKNKWLREFALISLALATGFKLYPIILAVLLLRDRQYFALIRAVIYSVAVVVVPFFIFYDGFESMKLMITHIIGFTGKRADGGNLETQLDFKRCFYFLVGGTRKITGITIDEGMLEVYANLFKYFLTAVCAIGALLMRKRWQVIMLCAAVMYGFPGSCATYMLVFFIPAVILFLDEEKKFNLLNFAYLGLMTLSLINVTLPIGGLWDRYYPSKISSAAVCMMVLLALCEMVVRFIIWNYERVNAGKGFFKACGERISEFLPDFFAKQREEASENE